MKGPVKEFLQALEYHNVNAVICDRCKTNVHYLTPETCLGPAHYKQIWEQREQLQVLRADIDALDVDLLGVGSVLASGWILHADGPLLDGSRTLVWVVESFRFPHGAFCGVRVEIRARNRAIASE